MGGGDFGFKAEMLLAVPGTLAWDVVYFFLITIVIFFWGGVACVSCCSLERWPWG